MYSSGYSHVSKYSPEAQRKMHSRSKGKSCGYYMRIVFFFSSLIQSLIIVSLVLFLIYGNTQDSASTTHIQDLEERFSRLSIENVALREQRKNLTTLLNITLTEKARNDWDLAYLRFVINVSATIIQDTDGKLQQCKNDLLMCKSTPRVFSQPIITPDNGQCGAMFERLKAKLTLVEVNFTRTVQDMTMEAEKMAKERDSLKLEAIHQRRETSKLEKHVEELKEKCKKDFIQSLSGVQEVTKAFLEKIDSLYSSQHNTFQLTCQNQRDHLEQIRTNCTSLSREVEDKFQRYLNNVGEQVSVIQSENSRLKAENWRLSEDFRWCSQNRTGLIQQHKQNLNKLQQKHDDEKERLLVDKIKLNGQVEMLEKEVIYKTKEAEHLAEQIKQLNMTCIPKTGFSGGSTSRTSSVQSGGWGSYGGGGSSSTSSGSSGVGQHGRTGYGMGQSAGSSASAFNKAVSTGTGSSGSSYSSSGSSSSLASSFNKAASTGTGSSGSSYSSSGSSSSLASSFNKQVSTGTGSSGSSYSSPGSSSSTGSGFKPGSPGGASSGFGTAGSSPNLSSSGRGSTSIGSPSGSSPNFSGIGSNKPASTMKTSSGIGSSSGSTASSKSGSSSSGFSWLGFGGSNSGQSKTGSGTGKGTSSGTGSSYGAGRTSGLGGGSSTEVVRHLQELYQIINSGNPQKNQDLTRVVG